MRVPSAEEVQAFLDASESRLKYRSLLPRSPSISSRNGISPQEVIRATELFLEEWLPTIHDARVRDHIATLDIGFALIPDSRIDAGYATATGIVGIHRGFVEFIRHRAGLNVLAAALGQLKKLSSESNISDQAQLSRSAAALDRVLENLESKTFEFALKENVTVDPLQGLLKNTLAERRDIIANGMLVFSILHEYGHAVVRKTPLPTVPPAFDEALILPVIEETRLPQWEEHMADAIACRSVSNMAMPWIISAVTVFFGVQIILEDLCYNNRDHHPCAANRIALLLHYTDIGQRYKTECQAMVGLGQAVASRRRQMGRESETLPDRRSRVERYVQARDPEIDASNLIAALSDIYPLEDA
jgi:hypothetical protein